MYFGDDSMGSFLTNNFVNVFTVTNTVGSVTNYADVGAATNVAGPLLPRALGFMRRSRHGALDD